MSRNTETARLDRIEALMRAMRDDCAVHGVLWSRETEALFAEVALARFRAVNAEEMAAA